MTKPRAWPNDAEWARTESIAHARKIDALARPMLDGMSMTEVERVQRAGQICRAALLIEKVLQAVGLHEFKKEI